MAGLALGKKVALATMGVLTGGGTGRDLNCMGYSFELA